MKIFIVFCAFFSLNLMAALDMKPGLWEVVSKIKANGKEIDPQAEIKKALAKVSPEQRKQMEAMIAQMSKGKYNLENGTIQICYSKEMLQDESNLARHGDKKCQTTVVEKSSTHVLAKFKCEGGEEGEADFTLTSKTNYKGQVKMNNFKGKNGEINYSGKFVSNDCGKVKPLVKK